MKVLIACEESQTVCKAFRALGHEAYSCDIQDCSGGHPEWHIQGDVLEVLNNGWDMIIAFPPCTYLTNAASVRLRVKGILQESRMEKAKQARVFFMAILNHSCGKIAIENPTPSKIHGLPECSQVIQPYQFGHAYSKRTCLWLKGLPPLMPTALMARHEPYINGGCKDAKGKYRKFQGRNERDQKTRSKTFQGIADAMAKQWSESEVK
jgi:hypothetical protein